jgi:hypothetical protein
MLIILNDDATYISWLSRHREGFVLDCKRKPTRRPLMLHRATCSVIKPQKRARLTTGAHLKACSVDATELLEWAREQTGGEPTNCERCQPDRHESAAEEHDSTHALTRLGRDIVSYVLDLAVMYLDGEARFYRPHIDTVATYLAKTPAQIAPALQRLLLEGYLECEPPADQETVSPKSILHPTALAMQTIPAFDAMSIEEVETELSTLRADSAVE